MKDKKQSELWDLLDQNKKLSDEEKLNFYPMANLYDSDLRNNLSRTTLDLNEIYSDYSVQLWRQFIRVPEIRKYIQSFKDEEINTKADEALMRGDKDGAAIKKVMQGQNPINNQNIVLIRVPDKITFDDPVQNDIVIDTDSLGI